MAGIVAHQGVRLAVDLIVLAMCDRELCVLLVRRGDEPFKGRWALPGGFVHSDEDPAAAAGRELREETGVEISASAKAGGERVTVPGGLEQLRTYGTPNRDPRGRIVSIAYLALLPDPPATIPGGDAADARWQPIHNVGRLAFDHDIILSDGIGRLRDKLEFAPVAAEFCPPEFTIAAVHRLYESVWDASLDLRVANAQQGPRRASSSRQTATHHDRGRQGDVQENEARQHFDP